MVKYNRRRVKKAGYEILNKIEPMSPPATLVQQIIVNQQNIFGNQIIKSTNTKYKDCSLEINNITGCNLKWTVLKSSNKIAYTLIPDTNICTVNENYIHSKSIFLLLWYFSVLNPLRYDDSAKSHTDCPTGSTVTVGMTLSRSSTVYQKSQF